MTFDRNALLQSKSSSEKVGELLEVLAFRIHSSSSSHNVNKNNNQTTLMNQLRV